MKKKNLLKLLQFNQVLKEELNSFIEVIQENDLSVTLDPLFPSEENGKILGQIFSHQLLDQVMERTSISDPEIIEKVHHRLDLEFPSEQNIR